MYGLDPRGVKRALSSTELLEETATRWVFSVELPTPRFGLRVATVDNRVLATGNRFCNKQLTFKK